MCVILCFTHSLHSYVHLTAAKSCLFTLHYTNFSFFYQLTERWCPLATNAVIVQVQLHLSLLFPDFRVRGGQVEPLPAIFGPIQGDALDKSPAHQYKAARRQTIIHIHILT